MSARRRAQPRVFVRHQQGQAPVVHVAIPWEALGVDPREFDGFTAEDWARFDAILADELGLAPTGSDGK